MDSTRGKVFIFSAPSGAGKTTIVHEMLRRHPEFCFSISATTRNARAHETHGKDYYFISKEEFFHYIRIGAFLEWEEVYQGVFYGTLKTEIERLLNEGHHVVFDVDVKGGSNLKAHFKANALAFFISPPSIEILKERLIKRGTESPSSIETRIQKAEKEMGYASAFDRIILNDTLERVFEEVDELITRFIQKPQNPA